MSGTVVDLDTTGFLRTCTEHKTLGAAHLRESSLSCVEDSRDNSRDGLLALLAVVYRHVMRRKEMSVGNQNAVPDSSLTFRTSLRRSTSLCVFAGKIIQRA